MPKGVILDYKIHPCILPCGPAKAVPVCSWQTGPPLGTIKIEKPVSHDWLFLFHAQRLHLQDVADLDQTWLASLDSFCSQKGEVAHNTKRATSIINPQDELATVTQLLVGLLTLDGKIRALQTS
jgi:hypothetical protein